MLEFTLKFIIGPLLCYLIGAIPFGYILVKLSGKGDIRKYGSGSIGATNAARVLGRWAFFVVFVFDVLKGLAAVLLVFNIVIGNPHFFQAPAAFWDFQKVEVNLKVMYGIAAIMGHLFPVYLKFRGGKGVATCVGVFVYLTPFAVGAAFIVWLVTYISTRYVSFGSVLAGITFSGSYLLSEWVFWPQEQSLFGADLILLTLMSLMVSVGVILTHRSNISRLLKGHESKSQL